MRSKVKKALMMTVLAFTLTACVSVKEYQKMYLNDKDMLLSDKPIEGFEVGFQTYREGASGANGGKTGGGCGCN
jgi:hypothetical protein